MGMFDNDIIYGGEQLQTNVELDVPYVLWECGIVARNVETKLGRDGVKAELVISRVEGVERDGTQTSSIPAKFGTFASSIVEKVARKGDGDLPAVVRFQVIPKAEGSTKQDAFVMTFMSRWTGGEPAAPLPELSPFIDNNATAPPSPTSTREQDGRKAVTIGGRTIVGDPTGADHPLND